MVGEQACPSLSVCAAETCDGPQQYLVVYLLACVPLVGAAHVVHGRFGCAPSPMPIACRVILGPAPPALTNHCHPAAPSRPPPPPPLHRQQPHRCGVLLAVLPPAPHNIYLMAELKGHEVPQAALLEGEERKYVRYDPAEVVAAAVTIVVEPVLAAAAAHVVVVNIQHDT